MDDHTRHLVGVGTESARTDSLEALRRLGRELDGPALDEVLNELWSGDRARRRAAILLAEIGDRPEFLESVLPGADATDRIRILSATTVPKLPTDTVSELLHDAPSAVRHRTYRSLRRHRHHPPADDLIERVRRWWGDREAARLLPVCSPHVITALLPELAHAVTTWCPLATRHPGIHVDELERQLAGLPVIQHDDCWRRHEDALVAIAPLFPHRLLDLLERFAPTHRLPSVVPHSRALARAAPGRYIQLLLGSGHVPWLRRTAPSREVFKALVAAEPPELVEFARRGNLTPVLAALPPSRREELYDAVRSQGPRWVAYNDMNLPLLPAPRRQREARQRIEGSRSAGDDDAALLAASHLPLEEARTELEPLLHSGEATERANAWRELIKCAVENRSQLGEVLAEVVRGIRNEQDPVRSWVLKVLSAIPPHRLAEAPVDTLDRLVRDAVRARDRSVDTVFALGDLARRVLDQGGGEAPTSWAVRTAATLFVEANWVPNRLTGNAIAEELWRAVRAFVLEQNSRGHFLPLLRIADGLGDRAWNLPELQEQLRRCIEHGTEDVAAGAVAKWLEDPRSQAARVSEVLALDRSAIALEAVQRAVFLWRGDLFRGAVAEAGAGKFLSEGDSRTPVRLEGAHRLAPVDRQLYADQLAEVVSDEGDTTHRRVAALHAVARIPGAGREVVEQWVDSGDVSLAEAALGALARTDEPERALPKLLAHGSGERARAAMTSAARCARFVRPPELADSLRRTLPTAAEVTTRKQLVHVCALLSPETTTEVVHTVWRPEEHRDVRAACAKVALSMSETTRAWSILHEALGMEREVTKPLFALRPLDIAERHRRDYADLLLAAVEQADRRTRQLATHALPEWNAFNDGIVGWLVETITGLDRSHWREAVSALVQLVASGEEQQSLETVVRRLAETVPGENRDADGDRDMPARQRLHAIVGAWGSSALRVSVSPHSTLVRVGHVLAESDPTLLPLAVEVLTQRIRTGDPDETLSDLRDIARLLHGRPGLAAETSRRFSEIVGSIAASGGLLPVAEELAASGTAAEGRFSVALCARANFRPSRSRQWRALIGRLRAHPEPEVAEAALAVFTVPE